MKNRDKYIIKANEYDMMLAIEKNTCICPIRAVAGILSHEKLERCYRHRKDGCEECVQEWLDEESY